MSTNAQSSSWKQEAAAYKEGYENGKLTHYVSGNLKLWEGAAEYTANNAVKQGTIPREHRNSFIEGFKAAIADAQDKRFAAIMSGPATADEHVRYAKARSYLNAESYYALLKEK